MTNSPARRAASNGFTLMELLVAMTLLGILMTVLFGNLRLGVRVWETNDRVLADESRLLSIRFFLNDRLEQVTPAELILSDGQGEIVFAGERSKLRMASTMPESVGFGPHIIELLLTSGDQGTDRSSLVIRWRLIQDSGVKTGATAFNERLLLSGLSDVSFGYFGAKDVKDGSAGWHATWQDQDHLPDLIRLKLRFPEEDGRRHWSPLVVSPQINKWHDTYY